MLLRNGVDLDLAIRTVAQLAQECEDIKAQLSGGPGDAWRTYVTWAATCERQLRNLFADPGAIEGLHTQRYWHLWTPGVHWASLIDAEIDVQVPRLNALASTLREYLHLRERPGHLAVVDAMKERGLRSP
jgi:hypothetical protein